MMYEVAAALFFSQMLGYDLSPGFDRRYVNLVKRRHIGIEHDALIPNDVDAVLLRRWAADRFQRLHHGISASMDMTAQPYCSRRPPSK